MRNISLRLIPLALLLPAILLARPIEVQREDSFDFALDPALLEKGSIQFFYEVIHRNHCAKSDPNFLKVKVLDRDQIYESRQHHVVIARSAYIVDQPIGFFSEERLTSLEYIDEVTGFDDFIRPSGYPINRIRKKGEVFVPSMDFVIQAYTPDNLSRKSAQDQEFYRRIRRLEPAQAQPSISLEYDYDNFGRIFFAKIIAGARTVVHHYPYSDNQTLVVSTMVNFLYRLPPSLQAMERQTRERAIDLILRTEEFKFQQG